MFESLSVFSELILNDVICQFNKVVKTSIRNIAEIRQFSREVNTLKLSHTSVKAGCIMVTLFTAILKKYWGNYKHVEFCDQEFYNNNNKKEEHNHAFAGYLSVLESIFKSSFWSLKLQIFHPKSGNIWETTKFASFLHFCPWECVTHTSLIVRHLAAHQMFDYIMRINKPEHDKDTLRDMESIVSVLITQQCVNIMQNYSLLFCLPNHSGHKRPHVDQAQQIMAEFSLLHLLMAEMHCFLFCSTVASW